MALIASKAPGGREGALADLAPKLLNSQLRRILAHLPENKPGEKPAPQRQDRFGYRPDGWWESHTLLPPDEGAIAQKDRESARDELFYERTGDDSTQVRGPTSCADAHVRMCERALAPLHPPPRTGDARGQRAPEITPPHGAPQRDGTPPNHP